MGDWVKFNKPYGPRLVTRVPTIAGMPDYVLGDTLEGLNLNVPGVQIELEDGTRHLIGDINEICGNSDDGCAFSNWAIVKRYRILLTPEQLKE